MAFLTSFWFRAEVSKPVIMDFISRTPFELYFLVPDGAFVYGMAVSTDVMEFLTNEFSVRSLEIVSASEVRKVMIRTGAKIWGNKGLLTF